MAPKGEGKGTDTHPLMYSQVICGSCPGLMSPIGLGDNRLFGTYKFPEPVIGLHKTMRADGEGRGLTHL